MKHRAKGASLSDLTPKLAQPRKLRALVKPRVLPPNPLTRAERASLEADEAALRAAGAMPRRPQVIPRDCPPGPCPFVACPHNLMVNVDRATEAITLNFPALEVHELRETCSLRAAKRGRLSEAQVGKLVNMTRDGVAQVVARALRKLKTDEVKLVLRGEAAAK